MALFQVVAGRTILEATLFFRFFSVCFCQASVAANVVVAWVPGDTPERHGSTRKPDVLEDVVHVRGHAVVLTSADRRVDEHRDRRIKGEARWFANGRFQVEDEGRKRFQFSVEHGGDVGYPQDSIVRAAFAGELRQGAARVGRRVADEARRHVEAQILSERRRPRVGSLVQVERRRELERVRARLRVRRATHFFEGLFVGFDAEGSRFSRCFGDRNRVLEQSGGRTAARDTRFVLSARSGGRFHGDPDHDFDLLVGRQDLRQDFSFFAVVLSFEGPTERAFDFVRCLSAHSTGPRSRLTLSAVLPWAKHRAQPSRQPVKDLDRGGLGVRGCIADIDRRHGDLAICLPCLHLPDAHLAFEFLQCAKFGIDCCHRPIGKGFLERNDVRFETQLGSHPTSHFDVARAVDPFKARLDRARFLPNFKNRELSGDLFEFFFPSFNSLTSSTVRFARTKNSPGEPVTMTSCTELVATPDCNFPGRDTDAR